jgi:hypothetical protein
MVCVVGVTDPPATEVEAVTNLVAVPEGLEVLKKTEPVELVKVTKIVGLGVPLVAEPPVERVPPDTCQLIKVEVFQLPEIVY